jgi:tRNA-2-methylthio-N6-dimethylallyladenosine synthase
MPSKRLLYIETFGCQMNQLESELIAGRLAGDGYALTPHKRDADLILFNTCSVREHAEERAFSHAGTVRKLKQRRPDLVVGIVGCAAQNHGAALWDRLPFVDMIVGPRWLGAIPRLAEEVRATGERRVATDDFDQEFIEPSHLTEARRTPFQAYVKVMEGCDLSCSFCIVPRTRGAEVSRRPEEIVDEVRRLVDGGVVEVTLLGQTVNSYGKGLKPYCDLAGLLERLNAVEGLRRIRFVTSHPVFMKRRLVEAMRDLPKVCKYIHIPAQSGSDRILALMKRRYTRARYLEIACELVETVPGIAIQSDFIVGFPTETDEDFDATASLLREVRFQGSFVFKYSPRPGTESVDMVDDVPEEIKKERNARLLAAQEEVSRERNRGLHGRRVEILVEGPSKTDPRRQTGRTDTNQIVVFEAGRDLRGRFADVEIERSTPLTLFGSLV